MGKARPKTDDWDGHGNWGPAKRADDRRTAANNEGSRSSQFGMGWASAANPESGSVARAHEREWGR
jgi:hypothetical protein